MNISKIILRNVACRKLSTSLTSISVALGVGLFVAIGSLRQASEQGFQRTAAICDTIVGAKGDSLQLSLNTLYHMGFSAGNISLDSFNEITNQDGVQWAVPVSSGDSYRGHRIVGVSSEFFDNVRIGGNEALGFSSGQAFEHSSSEFIASHQHLFLIDDHHDHDHGEMHQAVFKAVIGADVAQSLNLTIGDSIVPSHGVEGGA
ncbi:MAG: ABC transporter permease, partial [Planctomycetota bacterium]|nr:ABC transporter permease [Planctomycetota bacterium]